MVANYFSRGSTSFLIRVSGGNPASWQACRDLGEFMIGSTSLFGSKSTTEINLVDEPRVEALFKFVRVATSVDKVYCKESFVEVFAFWLEGPNL